MLNAQQFPFVERYDQFGVPDAAPLLPLTLTMRVNSLQAMGLLDTGASVNVLPYSMGLQLGAVWEQQTVSLRLAGNLGPVAARGLVVQAKVAQFRTVGNGHLLRRLATTDCQAFEHYENWLSNVAETAGIRRFRLIDEPSAVALGYGAHIQLGDVYLIFDFGGGTLDVAVGLIEESEQSQVGRRCRVLGKAGLDIGGATLDQ